MEMEKQKITIARYSDQGKGGFHYVHIVIPNEGLKINSSGDSISISAQWDKSRFQMPEVERIRS